MKTTIDLDFDIYSLLSLMNKLSQGGPKTLSFAA